MIHLLGGVIDKRTRKKDLKHKTFRNRHCEVAPPTISPSIIRNLGATFYDIVPTKLTKAALIKTKKASTTGGKKKVVKKNTKPDVDEDHNLLVWLSCLLLLLPRICNLNSQYSCFHGLTLNFFLFSSYYAWSTCHILFYHWFNNHE